MIARPIANQVSDLMNEFAVVALLGPRQVGKTTLALEWASRHSGTVYLDLEDPSDLARLSDPAAYLALHEGVPVVIDEIQRAPHLFPLLRGIVDKRRRAGRRTGHFLLLGSATGALLRQSSESLAGRIAYLELTPLSANEVPAPHDHRLWLRGGFPESFLARADDASLRWRQQFISTYLERDIPQLGPRLPAQTLRRLWSMLAHEQGQLMNAARLAASLAVSGQTVARYIDVLVDVMMVRRLPPWASNGAKRLVRAPKVYVRDSGLVHALLGLRSIDDLLSHPVAGGSWEGWVVESLLAAAPPQSQAFFYRSSAGAEIDLLLQLPHGALWAVEIKRSSAPVLNRGFHAACDDLKVARALVVHGGKETFPLAGGVQALPLARALSELQGKEAQSGAITKS